ncbi:hypothetical protein GCM10009655_14150 [Rhodoglobus aureus]|uniref:Uncharacterized protein n=2 Tax=Rhodoglobus aureus TaxID=191497 RepID=A0ABN1VLG2_9MICO
MSELSGDTFDEFLDNVDAVALSADDEIVRDRMLKFIDDLPPNYLLTSGAGLESLVDLNNDVSRACDAAGAPIATLNVGS